MSNTAVYASAGALAGALIALLLYHLAIVRPAFAAMQRRVTTHDELISGGNGSAADRLSELTAGRAEDRAATGRLEGRLGELEALATGDVSQIGFVRYNALDDTGSDLSYALALLNRRGDGVVLSSIYSRTDTRTYGKAVAGYKPAANASEEEMHAIERARASTGS
jgi:hypothetical protein